MKIKYCINCANPSTRPNIQFNERGLCPVCQYEEEKKISAVDWRRRHQELKEICQWGKNNTKTTYDCIVTVSGGKDSTLQACYARDELGMNPLLVSCLYSPEQSTQLGADNLANLIRLGFDTLTVSLNPILWKRLMRESFFKVGNWAKPNEMALFATPIHAAIAYQIPLIFYGENPVYTLGENTGSLTGDASKLKKGNTIAGGPSSILPEDVTPQDAHFYYYPTDNEMERAHLRLIYLGYYMENWSMRNNADFAIKKGLKTRNDAPENIGDLWGFSSLDEDYSIVNQFLKYLKLGFGRVTDQVCEEINSGQMTREEAFRLIKKYDGKCHQTFIARACHYLEITEEKFWETAERFRNPHIWYKDENNQWQLNTELEIF